MRTTVLFLTFSLAACSPSVDSPAETTLQDASRSDATGESTVVLSVGQDVVVGGLTLGLVEVPEDSRCPVDVTCVWAGDVVVVVATLMDGVERVLSLHLNPRGDGVRSVTLDGYTITFETIEPEPHSGRTIPPEGYRATFQVISG